MTNSDYWEFPTNQYPNIGWLGRVHRGTPWQTVYFKGVTNEIDLGNWTNWSGNQSVLDAMNSQPVNDRHLFDLFTTALTDNATRGRLSVNQTNIAAWAAVLQGVETLADANTPVLIDPTTNSSYLAFSNLVTSINGWRAATNTSGQLLFPGQVFTNVGDILSVPALTTASPFLSTAANAITNDAVIERLPQQVMNLLKAEDARYVIYGYGQSLKPADHSIYLGSGQYFGMCTNYQITGEVLTRAVVRVDNRPVPGQPLTQPRIVVESYNVIPPE